MIPKTKCLYGDWSKLSGFLDDCISGKVRAGLEDDVESLARETQKAVIEVLKTHGRSEGSFYGFVSEQYFVKTRLNLRGGAVSGGASGGRSYPSPRNPHDYRGYYTGAYASSITIFGKKDGNKKTWEVTPDPNSTHHYIDSRRGLLYESDINSKTLGCILEYGKVPHFSLVWPHLQQMKAYKNLVDLISIKKILRHRGITI